MAQYDKNLADLTLKTIFLSAAFEGEVQKTAELASNNRINRKRESEALL